MAPSADVMEPAREVGVSRVVLARVVGREERVEEGRRGRLGGSEVNVLERSC